MGSGRRQAKANSKRMTEAAELELVRGDSLQIGGNFETVVSVDPELFAAVLSLFQDGTL